MRCTSPFQLKERNKLTGDWIVVPCGRCPPCVKRKASQWSFRILQEEKISVVSHFVTMTYAPKNIRLSAVGYMTLYKKDLQNFMKRLRHRVHDGLKLRYYAVGEYGTERSRPHYHALIFNAEMKDIEKSWDLGAVHYGKVEGASVGYCMKYMHKRNYRVGVADGDDRLPEFAVMSKGIGKNYLTRDMAMWHLEDLENRMYVHVDGNKKASLPRYYRDRLFSDSYFENAAEAEHRRLVVGNVNYARSVKQENEIRAQVGDAEYDWQVTQRSHEDFLLEYSKAYENCTL